MSNLKINFNKSFSNFEVEALKIFKQGFGEEDILFKQLESCSFSSRESNALGFQTYVTLKSNEKKVHMENKEYTFTGVFPGISLFIDVPKTIGVFGNIYIKDGLLLYTEFVCMQSKDCSDFLEYVNKFNSDNIKDIKIVIEK